MVRGRIGQRFKSHLVDLATWQERKRFNHKQLGRHCGRRQTLLKKCTQFAWYRGLLFLLADDECDEPLLVRIAYDHRGGVLHRGVAAERTQHLVELQPDTPQLHLIVVPAEIKDRAVRATNSAVASIEQDRRRCPRDRIGPEALGSQIRLAPIAKRQASAACMDHAGHADRGRLTHAVENVDLRISNRFANRYGPLDVRILNFMNKNVGCHLGRSIEIDQFSARASQLETSYKIGGENFAAHRPHLERRQASSQIGGVIEQHAQ